MSLKKPVGSLTGTTHHYKNTGWFNAIRLEREKAIKGFAQHQVTLHGGERSQRGARLVLVWPSDLPGTLAIDFHEESKLLANKGSKGYAAGEPEIGDVVQGLTRVVFSRDKASLLSFGETGEKLYGENDLFEGAMIDVDVLLYDTEDTTGEPRDRVLIKGIPLMKQYYEAQADDTDRYEGWDWELGAWLRFVPFYLSKSTLDHWNWSGGDSTPTFTRIPFRHRVRFKVKANDEEEKPDWERDSVPDRYVFALEVTRGIHKEEPYLAYAKYLLYLPQGKAPLKVEAESHAETTTSRKRSLKSLRGRSRNSPAEISYVEDGKRYWIQDLVVKAKAHPERGEGTSRKRKATVARPIHTFAYYWLLPEDFSERREARISKVDRPGQVGRMLGHSKTGAVVFELSTDWDTYSHRLRQLLEHLEAIRTLQRHYDAYYTQHKQEIEAYTRIVRPIVEGFHKVEWDTKGLTWLSSHKRRFDQVEDGAGTYRTQSKIAKLRRYTKAMAFHQREALKVFSDPRFGEFFQGRREKGRLHPDPFLGKGKVLKREARKGKHVTLKAETYSYDDNLKLRIVAELAGNYCLLAGMPKLDHEGDHKAQADDFRRKARARASRFLGHLAAPISAILEAELDESKVPYFLSERPSPDKFWAFFAMGGYALALYGDPKHRSLLTKVLKDAAGEASSSSRLLRDNLFDLDSTDWGQLRVDVKETFKQDWLHREKHGVPLESVMDSIDVAMGMLDYMYQGIALLEGGLKGLKSVDGVLSLTEFLLTTTENWFKLQRMLNPQLRYENSIGLTYDGARLGSRLERIGTALKLLAILQESLKVMRALWRWGVHGDSLDPASLVFSVLNIVAVGLSLASGVLATIGSIVGVLLLFAEAVVDYYDEGPTEKPIAWYCRTPWGKNPNFDYGKLHWNDPKALFAGALEALNHFFDEAVEHLPEKQEDEIFNGLQTFYRQYAEGVAAYYGLKVNLIAKKGYYLKVILEGQRG